MILFLRQQRVFLYHITIGGGRRSLSDIKNLLRLGADKVSIKMRVIKNLLVNYEASREFCYTTFVLCIEAIISSIGE